MHKILDAALVSMTEGPECLDVALAGIAQRRKADPVSQDDIAASLAGADRNPGLYLSWSDYIAECDYAASDLPWTAGTPKNSRARRDLAYRLLELGSRLRAETDSHLAISTQEKPVVIADRNEFPGWYDHERRRHRPFWKAYGDMLKPKWGSEGIQMLDEASDAVLRKMPDPLAEKAYQSKGLVFGYVQSGKTANFTAVIAKGIDAGYRLFIVLAGTTDELRNQTQGRLDDLDEYISKGPPLTPKLQMLTKVDNDYQSLEYGLSLLGFGNVAGGTFNTHENLASAHAVIIVIKKVKARLDTLISDLKKVQEKALGRPWAEVPAMIIDDESDLASINTRRRVIPTEDPEETKAIQQRTACNAGIVQLLHLLPRCQYVGYTATPAATLLIDKLDRDDLYPWDYAVSLPRPIGYVGAAYFVDLEAKGKEDPRPNKAAFVREFSDRHDEETRQTLREAIDLFVLSGAVKLYRLANASDLIERGKMEESFKHHTMLVHSSSRKREHVRQAKQISELFARSGYSAGEGFARLRELYQTDVRRVALERCTDIDRMAPASFDEIAPYVHECLRKIDQHGLQPAIFVNSDDDSTTPEFKKRPYWKIMVGGTKLSRGFTLEGLTVSYYNRSVAAADTLMQMGRWFGFRSGYADLIRLFITTKARLGGKGPKGRDVNLYDAFAACCRDDEYVREQLRSNEIQGLKPGDIQSRIEIPVSLLMPTAKNKSQSATTGVRDYQGDFTEQTGTAKTPEGKAFNRDHQQRFLSSISDFSRRSFKGKWDDCNTNRSWMGGIVSHADLMDYITRFKFASDGLFAPQINYLAGSAGRDPEIDDWAVLIPEGDRNRGNRAITIQVGEHELWLRRRNYVLKETGSSEKYNTYTVPGDRPVPEYIAGHRSGGKDISPHLASFRRARRGVIMIFNTVRLKTDLDITTPPEHRLAVYEPGFTLHIPKRESGSVMAANVLVQRVDLMPAGA